MAGLLLTATACNAGQGPFRQVQFCFVGQSDIPQLKDRLKQVAADYHLAYRDISDTAFDQLKRTGVLSKQNKSRSAYIDVYADREDGMGFGAGNLSLGDDQVAIAFTAGGDLATAQRLAGQTVAELQKTWQIHEVAANSGAFPLDCSHAR